MRYPWAKIAFGTNLIKPSDINPTCPLVQAQGNGSKKDIANTDIGINSKVRSPKSGYDYESCYPSNLNTGYVLLLSSGMGMKLLGMLEGSRQVLALGIG